MAKRLSVGEYASAPGLVSGGVIVDEGQVSKKIRELLEVVQHVKPETSGIQKLT